ncbi:hypothetical protein PSQ90_05320 [Devosia rhodophyticola]|uniref:Aldose 1-epimerase n=1 Tax=Devosia rhodophyticola TaxID=3026423 RepID=A0ABY7Z032_9HYPH|nr:hypothetical protein [Devosia rhodophyticola]WDR06871.1 hypothetical protein PSQ90_05320 [Devosia rhodophyticola]
MDNLQRALTWDHGVLSVQTLGAMLGPTLFVLPDGRQISPFQIAPWANEPNSAQLPGILRRLRGEWPCVPFGSDEDRPAHDGWPGSTTNGRIDAFAHGFGANNHWRFDEAEPDQIGLSITYPQTHPIASLDRVVRPDADGAAIDFELRINARADCVLPIGLHPCFRLPHHPGAMRVEIGSEIAGATYPIDVDGTSIFSTGQMLAHWNEVPLRNGGQIDASRLPLVQQTEELLQLFEMPGKAALWNTAEGYRVRFSWDQNHFPSTLLWISNRGRQATPWNGRHLALGMEPICGAFDLGPQISAADNPIARRGTPTVRQFRAGEQFVTRYRIEVEPAETI